MERFLWYNGRGFANENDYHLHLKKTCTFLKKVLDNARKVQV